MASLLADRRFAPLFWCQFLAAFGDNALKSRSLTRALSAVTALQLGVSGEGGVAGCRRCLVAVAFSAAWAMDPSP